LTDILFIHNGVSGRFRAVAAALAARGWRLAVINDAVGNDLPGATTLVWRTDRKPAQDLYPPARRAEIDLVRARAAAEAALKLKAQGFDPKLIIGHPGWGEMAFLGEVFPDAPQIQVGEFYYRTRGADVGFDAEFAPSDFEDQLRVHAKNTVLTLSYAAAERIVAPTPFQASLLPASLKDRVRVIHEGVDTEFARPESGAQLKLPSGRVLDRSTPVVTFVNRVFEPMRGVHSFMRALPRLLEAEPDVQVLMIGSEQGRGYGAAPPPGKTWMQVMLQELQGRLDVERIHLSGPLPHAQLVTAFSISAAHVYLTYPFVLSWSLLEAMACEALVIGSDTAPVRDVIVPGENGLLVDFFDHQALADTIAGACREPERYEPLRKAARRRVIEGYDRTAVCDPAWLALIDEVLAERA
jgi:glycosyltransferase involved in cell wall biosynthesis